MPNFRWLFLALIPLAASGLDAQNCSGVQFNNANTLAPISGNQMAAFARDGDLPYFTSTLTLSAPYSASLPSVIGNQLLEGCFAANPKLVASPLSYQAGAGSQRSAIIRSGDNKSIGFAMLFFGSSNSVKIWKLNPDLSIGGPQVYSMGVNLNAVLTADFNGDGKPDLAVVGQADSSSSGLWILINNGDTTFQAPVKYALPDFASSAAAGDFNGDGKIDLAAASYSFQGGAAGKVITYFGNGDGTLRSGATYAAGTSPQGLAVADLDGDGVVDLAVADGQTNTVAELKGNHDGSFNAYSALLSSVNPTYIAVGDFNNDGHADLGIVNSSAGTVSVALASGGGMFASPKTYNALYQGSALVVTDVNQDGHPDLVVGSGTPDALGADVNAGEIAVLMNDGDGSFQASPQYSFVSNPMQLAVADFDGDGKLDVASADSQGTSVAVLYGQGAGKFGPPTTFAADDSASQITSLASADFNDDGKADLLLGSASGQAVTLALSKTGRSFQTSTLTMPDSVQAVITGDFNGDTHPDAVVAFGSPLNPSSTSAGIAVLPGDGHGGFGAPIVFQDITGAHLAAADLNRDGKLDLAVAGASVPTSGGRSLPGLTVLLGQGNGSFTRGQTLFASYSVAAVSVGDLNGDLIPDLVATIADSSFSVSIGVALGKGDGTFSDPAIPFQSGIAPSPSVLADLDGDGKLDLVTGISGTNDAMYALGNGDGTFQSQRLFDPGPLPFDIRAADVNGDGKLDLLIGNQSQGGGLTALVTIAPTQAGGLSNVSGASFLASPLPSESIATAFGSGLATQPLISTQLPLPTNVNNTVVTVTDSKSVARQAPLFYVSDKQVNYEVPPGTAAGIATVSIASPLGTSSGQIDVEAVSPAIFEANAVLGPPVGSTDRVGADLSQTFGAIVTLDSGNNIVALPIDLGLATDKVYLTLYATGVRQNSGLADVSATVGGVPAQVLYAGPQGSFVGLDQVNLQIPPSLKGKGQVDVLLTVDGLEAPPVEIVIQ